MGRLIRDPQVHVPPSPTDTCQLDHYLRKRDRIAIKGRLLPNAVRQGKRRLLEEKQTSDRFKSALAKVTKRPTAAVEEPAVGIASNCVSSNRSQLQRVSRRHSAHLLYANRVAELQNLRTH